MSITPRKAGVVLLGESKPTPDHELAVQRNLAQRIATLLGTRFLDDDGEGEANLYYLPSQTLIADPRYAAMGIRHESDFFGGLVSQPFMATKAISHALFPQASAPQGWNDDFARQAGDALLGGFTVFNLADAQAAATHLLKQAPLRLKPVRATAGRGQTIIRDRDELDLVLSHMDEQEILTWGLVLEENLTEVSTYSVGQVCVAGIVASYHGTQQLTEDHSGALVYGGSDLVVVRGDYAQLLQLELDDATRLAVEQAQRYEHAAQACFPGFIASRRNYDIARGRNHLGQLRSGVLEQSWRVGGASSAEVLALEAFAANPALTCVRASTHEVFGDVQVPADATLFYQGDDREVGSISKFARIRAYEHS
ncbi:MAG: DUF3182 family protein [Pseudomonas sp.]|uniref:DUF3182 family protein n=1 Tax=Pseudomonas abieticivorans TaxID=2931382 RepID=UPI0020BE7C5C|nr:DUF3182 family protein [Pseudomonas sp. PIA16]MDE1165389.1 DUF3182 family protein [Pseudomonas sp.]